MKNFLQGRLKLAKKLLEEPCADYADIALILMAVLSACAAYRWPGQAIDKKRFVELLALHSDPSHCTTWVSVPALINTGKIKQPLVDTFLGKIVTGEDVDFPIDKAEEKYPNITKKDLKTNSYAFLIYAWLRCGYAHEYIPNLNITSYPPSHRNNTQVSYICRGDMSGKVRIMVGFHIEYLLNLAQFHVERLQEKCEKPTRWWIEYD